MNNKILTAPIDTALQRDAIDIALRKLYDLRDAAKQDIDEAADLRKQAAELAAMARHNALSDAILAVNSVHLDLLRAETEALAATRRAMGTH